MTALATGSPTTARPRGRLVGGLLAAAVALLALAAISLVMGSRDVSPSVVLEALVAPSPSADATVIREMRLPRTVLAIVVGAALALGGTLLQGVARNALADPGVMGINSGAASAVVIGVLVLGSLPIGLSVWFAFAGAAVATVIVYAVASTGREGATPVKLALAGAAVTAVGSSLASAVVLANPDSLNELRMWQVGALAGRYWPVLGQVGPYLLLGGIAALLTGRALNLLSLGDDLARSLGMRVAPARAAIFVIVTLLCGAATAACGPIVFVGLMVPHLARLITGPDYRWILGYSVLLGPVLLLICDVLGRVLLPSGEVPVGVVVGILGAPVFVALVRYRRLAEV